MVHNEAGGGSSQWGVEPGLMTLDKSLKFMKSHVPLEVMKGNNMFSKFGNGIVGAKRLLEDQMTLLPSSFSLSLSLSTDVKNG